MNAVGLIDGAAAPSVLSGAWTARMARRLAWSRLALLQAGQLRVVEQGGTISFGSLNESFPQPVHVEVHDPRLYQRLIRDGSVGAGESYMRGEWGCDDLLTLVRILIRNENCLAAMDGGLARVWAPLRRLWHLLRRNTRHGSRQNIAAHYDLGNDFYKLFLDETLMYSAAWFERPEMSLAEASTAKNDLLCRKLELKASDELLEIGTGWGGFALHAAQHYGCRVVTTTISQQQHAHAVKRVRVAGLQGRVRVLLQDYRDLQGQFDKIVSIEMIEAVGHEYLDAYFRCCDRLLKPGGRFALQAITIADQRYESYRRDVDFIQRFIFPGGCLPCVTRMAAAVQQSTKLQWLHLEDFTLHYARTLACWRERFQNRLDEVRALGFDEVFLRMWEFYLCYCEAAFLERATASIQAVFVKPMTASSSAVFAPVVTRFGSA